MMGLLWALACGSNPSVDPGLTARREAIATWEHGHAALENGDAPAARAAFRQARGTYEHPLLLGWEATAFAMEGNLEAAAARAAEALALDPDLAALRYNRASWLVRLGRIDEAGPELESALASGAADGLSVLEDPTFREVLDQPAFAFLPDQPLLAQIGAPDPVAFLGGELTLSITLLGLIHEPWTLVMEEAKGPITLVRGIEDRVGTREVRWSWTFRVGGAGEIVLGPFTLTAGGRQVTLDAVRSEASAPPEHEAAPLPPIRLWRPSQLGEDLEPRRARWRDGLLVVRVAPADQVSVEPSAGAPVQLDAQVQGRTSWALKLYRVPAPTEVVIREPDGTEAWRGAPAR